MKKAKNLEKRKHKLNLQDVISKEEQKGITLIALVITIIVLLILAGVTIATLTGDNGILTKAQDASEKTKIGDEQERVRLSVVGALAQDNGGKIKRNYLNDELTSYIGKEGTDYTLSESEMAPFVVTYSNSKKSYLIDENGNVSEYVDISKYVKIGDYVEYKPTSVTEPYDKFGETYSGYANENIGQDNTLKWRVLNINTNGTVELISDKPTSTTVYFKGARGYNNAVYLLNDYCNTMYSNSSINAKARSLNIEDIQDKMKVDNITEKKAYENYRTNGGGTEVLYGESFSHNNREDNKWYPLQWKNDNGIEGESKQIEAIEYTTENDAQAENDTSLTVIQTYWYLSSSNMQSNFISAVTRDDSKSNDMYYELLCNNGDLNYWLASRCVNAYYNDFPEFGIRTVNNGDIHFNIMFSAMEYMPLGEGDNYVRPVVMIQANVIDTSTDYEIEGYWKLK